MKCNKSKVSKHTKCTKGTTDCTKNKHFKTVSGIVRCYQANWPEHIHEEFNAFEILRDRPDIAIRKAGLGRESAVSDGKHSHQNRISPAVLEEAASALLEEKEKLLESGSFDILHDRIVRIYDNISGVGELAMYDAALRIGYCIGCEPQYVYLHAGAREGAENYFGETSPEAKSAKLSLENLPEFEGLKPAEIESLFCICKKCIANMKEAQ